MKKLMLTVCLVLGLLIVAAPMAMADTINIYQTSYSSGIGGEFTVHINDNTLSPDLNYVLNNYSSDTKNIAYSFSFQTFCVETETFSPGTEYNFTISDHSIFTNKPLTLGAAWLYHEFQNGTLTGYEYNVDGLHAAGRQSDAGALQAAIWYFMGIGVDPGNEFSLAGNAHGGLTENNGQIPVAVLNVWTLSGGAAQDQLVCVPEPGILILLGIAMSAIGMASWRIRKL